MRTLAIVLACAALAAPGLARAYDHFDPADLVAAARLAMSEGDFATACVLLSRAAKLSPNDARVSFAWGDYEAAQNGVPIAAPAPSKPPSVAPVAAARPAGPVPAEPPPLWPSR